MNHTIDKSIEIICERKEYSLGQDIDIGVIYKNKTNSPISFRDPAKTWSVMLEVSDSSQNKAELPFGKVLSDTDAGITSQFEEDADDILLDKNHTYKFMAPINKRYLFCFTPGEKRIRLNDFTRMDGKIISSNYIELKIKVTKDSFAYLTAILSDKTHSIENKIFAVEWLKEIKHDFEYVLENPTKDQKLKNEQMIKDSMNWWSKNKDSTAVDYIIGTINQKAGVN